VIADTFAALHAKAKAEAGYRFYALYDKISRDDILAHAYAQCRSKKGRRQLTRSCAGAGVSTRDFLWACAGFETAGV
jgi:hypothetical protein